MNLRLTLLSHLYSYRLIEEMEKLSKMVNFSLVSRLVLVGYDHEIFDHLEKPISVTELSKVVLCDVRYLQEWCEESFRLVSRSNYRLSITLGFESLWIH